MADDVTRWSVTYTKYIKQKRKVYQDGFLEVQSSSHKVKLYDECDKLLDSKIVKLEDDAVRSGETITLGAYLIDIGDPIGDIKPIPNVILQRDKAIADKAQMSNTKTMKVSSRFGKPSSINLSPSQKIIREFKKREVKKYYSPPPSCPDKIKDESTEWEVLYTTQLTQKSKKFHDGILKVSIAGLRGRQAILYDETRRQLDSKFLKNDETVTAGDSMKFDAHLVDIIELKDNKSIKDSNVDRRNSYKQNTMQSKIQNDHLSDFKKHEPNKFVTKSDLKEWDVMYTTQVTQKAKKFHDGILKLTSSGSQGREEATLLAEDGTVLSHRYLKLSEEINSGSLFNISNYLVEIGDQRKNSKGEGLKKGPKLENETLKSRSFGLDNIKLSKRIPITISDEKPLKRELSMENTDLKAKVISASVNNEKPLRDARSILSFLRKPSGEQSVDIKKEKDSCVSTSDVAVCNEEKSKVVDNDILLETVVSPDSSNHKANDLGHTNSTKTDFPSFDLGFGFD